MNHVQRPLNIAILGATGSIGRSTLEVIAALPDRFRVAYLTAHGNIGLLQEQVRRFRPDGVAVSDPRKATALRGTLGGSTEVLAGESGLCELVTRPNVDIVVSALVGFAGLRPTLAAIEAGKTVALANKETLVAGGEIVMQKVRESRGRLLPVDSEHSAILQCLQGENAGAVERLILTASGGPFFRTDIASLDHVTVDQALNHPTWRMGNKITIDSATLMNKGLEVIEAHWLFGIPPDRIDVVIHPQSIIHSMVEFADGSVKAQLGVPDMRLPIQYALTYPERPAADHRRIDFAALAQMTFFEPDPGKFRCLALAYQAMNAGGTAPAVLNAANEVAVGMFLAGSLPFTAIPAVIEEALAAHSPVSRPSLNDIVAADAETRGRISRQPAAARP